MKIAKAETEIGFLLTQVSLLKQRINNNALKSLNLTYMQFVVMAAIYEFSEQYDEPLQQLLISKRQLDKSMVSGILKTLIERKLVERYENPNDTRSKVVMLTSAGQSLVVDAKEIIKTIDEKFFNEVDHEFLKSTLMKLYSFDFKK
jgi:DNA-binding MarR family transcriptional regulator